MTAYKPQVGDRVRVVLEGEVVGAGKDHFDLDDYGIEPADATVVSVEQVGGDS